MKKYRIWSLFLAAALLFSLCACGGSSPSEEGKAGSSSAMQGQSGDSAKDDSGNGGEAAGQDSAGTEMNQSSDSAGHELPALPMLTDTRPEEYQEYTFTTLNGDEVTFNRNTRKIVCLFGSQDVVAFGIPLLAYENSTEIEGYESFYEGAEKLLNSSPFSPEEILSFEPELILVNERMSESNIAALSKVAPVIPLYTDSIDFTTRLSYIGEIFGLEDSAEQLIAYADGLRDAMVQQLKDLGLSDKTLTLFTYMGAITIPPERGWFMNTILYDYVGLKRLPNVEKFMQDESGVAYEAISAEKLMEYEGDLVIYAGFGEGTISTYVTENVGWQSLKAVRENRVGILDITPYAQKGVILLEVQYRQILEALKAAAQIG